MQEAFPVYQESLHESELEENTEEEGFALSEATSDTYPSRELKTKVIKKEKKFSSIKKRRPSSKKSQGHILNPNEFDLRRT